jgi:hypothetical protein
MDSQKMICWLWVAPIKGEKCAFAGKSVGWMTCDHNAVKVTLYVAVLPDGTQRIPLTHETSKKVVASAETDMSGIVFFNIAASLF